MRSGIVGASLTDSIFQAQIRSQTVSPVVSSYHLDELPNTVEYDGEDDRRQRIARSRLKENSRSELYRVESQSQLVRLLIVVYVWCLSALLTHTTASIRQSFAP